ncbi:LOW QUALITY PROTEIN: hypothetical protein YC2023_106877 [Brassica napus]
MSTKPNGKSIISSDGNGESKTGSNPIIHRANGKTHVFSDDNRELMIFNKYPLVLRNRFAVLSDSLLGGSKPTEKD